MSEPVCPNEDLLWPVAVGEQPDVVVAAHVDTCSSCQSRVTGLQADLESLRDVASHSTELSNAEQQTAVNAHTTTDEYATQDVQVEYTPSKRATTSVPDEIGRYRVLSVLGEGGQGVVCRAMHPNLPRDVIIKLSKHPFNKADEQRDHLVREARLLSEIEHPNLAKVLDLDFFDNKPFLVLEYARGIHLGQYAKEQTLTSQQIAALLAKVARALAVAHNVGVVHQDVKPQNIVINPDGEPILIDFGMACLRDAWVDETARQGTVSGTPAYMAPEQARGETNDVGPRSDVFAMGAILYFLLTGKAPFAGKTVSQVVASAAACDFDTTVLENVDAPAGLKRICLKAMQKNLEKRYTSATEFADDLDRFNRPPRSWRRWVAAAASVAALLAIGLLPDWRSDAPVPAPVKPTFSFTVSRRDETGNKTPAIELVDSAPLSNGDLLQIQGKIPLDYQIAILSFTSEGRIEQLEDFDVVETATFAEILFPKPGNDAPLTGAPGTEVLLICGRKGRDIKPDELSGYFDGAEPWPALPPKSTVRFDSTRTWIPNSRSFAVEAAPEKPVVDLAERLRKNLLKHFDSVDGIVFSHRESTARLPESKTRDISPLKNSTGRSQHGNEVLPLNGIPQDGKGLHALLIGCTDYYNLPATFSLTGPGNDMRLMKMLLVNNFQFQPAGIVTLAEHVEEESKRPTAENIRREFENLIAGIRIGDRVVVHMAGHGSWQPDDDPDNPEDYEPDGRDEVFCPADTKLDEDAKFINVITDDEFRGWFTRLVRAGATVWLIADCCHSGTISRAGDADVARSLRPEDLLGSSQQTSGATARAVSRGASEAAIVDEEPDHVDGKFVALYASQPFEVTYESKYPRDSSKAESYGILSYALYQVLNQTQSPLTYREVVQRIHSRYLSEHRTFPTPFLEGDADSLVLETKVLTGRSTLVLEKTGDEFTVNAGSLHDLTHGSVLAVKPAVGQQDHDRVLGYVKVTNVGPLESTVEPCTFAKGTPLRGEFPRQNRCEIAYLDFGLRRLKLSVDNCDEAGHTITPQRRLELRRRLDPLGERKQQSLISLIDDPLEADWLIRPTAKGLVLVPGSNVPGQTNDNDRRVFGPIPENQLAEWVGLRMERIARATNLIRITSAPQEEQVRGQFAGKVVIELLRYDDPAAPNSEGRPVQWQKDGIKLIANEHIRLRIKNDNEFAIDTCVLFVGSNFQILQVFPFGGNRDSRLKPHSQLIKKLGEVTADTVGLEHMAVIVVPTRPQSAPISFSFMNQPTLEIVERAAEELPQTLESPLVQLMLRARNPAAGVRGSRTARLDQPNTEQHFLRLFSWQTQPDMR